MTNWQLKPIETVYNGYRFRSRLEARWAVVFDQLNIRYQYEVEGFDLDGLWYLPDFWLPDYQLWFEIKGDEPLEESIEKALRLSSAYLVIMPIGECRMEMDIIVFGYQEQIRGHGLWLCPRCMGLAFKGEVQGDVEIRCLACGHDGHYSLESPEPEALLAGYTLHIALDTARQTRFGKKRTA